MASQPAVVQHSSLQGIPRSLDEFTEQLSQLAAEAQDRADEDGTPIKRRVWEAMQAFTSAMTEVQQFASGLEGEMVALEEQLEDLLRQRKTLNEERDDLIEKGHELNCRIGYNALERKLEETFASIERYTSEDSARCFKDEAEERLKRCRDLTRVANMRTCQVDRELFNQMEDITALFQSYEKDRQLYVKELDLFTDVRRTRISEWLAEPRTEDQQERGEAILEYLDLQEKRRHLDSHVIRNALRMYSFNASLAFDREDNQKMLEELGQVQERYQAKTGDFLVLPRHSKARPDLTQNEASCVQKEDPPPDPPLTYVHGDQDSTHGRSLHRCDRQTSLAFDPITDPGLVALLEENLRWSEKEWEQPSSAEEEEVKDGHQQVSVDDVLAGTRDSILWGDAELAGVSLSAAGGLKAPASEMCHPQSAHSLALRHAESHPAVPAPGKRTANTAVSRRKSGVNNRLVCSLTSMADGRAGEAASDTKAQGSEPVLKSSSGGAKAREWPPHSEPSQ